MRVVTLKDIPDLPVEGAAEQTELVDSLQAQRERLAQHACACRVRFSLLPPGDRACCTT